MFTSQAPNDWRDLQEKVAIILAMSGFEVEKEKKLRGVRGKVEIDVYGEEEIGGRKYVILCECKYWKAAIPQTIIHAFRTVLGDVGANIGYIITTSNFQSGSFEASKLSNVKLLNWVEFQEEFESSWYSKTIEKLHRQLDGGMLSLSGEHRAGSRSYLPESDKEESYRIASEYGEFYSDMKYLLERLTFTSKLKLPLRANYINVYKDKAPKIPDMVLDAPGFLELIVEVASINEAAFAKEYEIHARNRHLRTERVHGFTALPHMIRQLKSDQ